MIAPFVLPNLHHFPFQKTLQKALTSTRPSTTATALSSATDLHKNKAEQRAERLATTLQMPTPPGTGTVIILLFILTSYSSFSFTPVKPLSPRRPSKILMCNQSSTAATDKKATTATSSRPQLFKYESSEDISSVYHRMDVIDAKKPAKYGRIAFIASIISIPIWATVLLPFTLISSTINFLYYNLPKLFVVDNKAVTTTIVETSSETIQQQSNTSKEEEKVVINSIPRENRKYDLILFGATGFVGKLAVSYPYGFYLVNLSRWKMAGGTEPPLEKGARAGVVIKMPKPAG